MTHTFTVKSTDKLCQERMIKKWTCRERDINNVGSVKLLWPLSSYTQQVYLSFLSKYEGTVAVPVLFMTLFLMLYKIVTLTVFSY